MPLPFGYAPLVCCCVYCIMMICKNQGLHCVWFCAIMTAKGGVVLMLFDFLRGKNKSDSRSKTVAVKTDEPNQESKKPRRSSREADYLDTKRIELIHSDTGTREPVDFYFCPLSRLPSCLDIRLYEVGSNGVIDDIVGCGLYYYVDGKQYDLPKNCCFISLKTFTSDFEHSLNEANLGHVYKDKDGRSVIYNGGILYEFNEDELKKISKLNYSRYEQFYDTQYHSCNRANYHTRGLTDGDIRAINMRVDPECDPNDWFDYY